MEVHEQSPHCCEETFVRKLQLPVAALPPFLVLVLGGAGDVPAPVVEVPPQLPGDCALVLADLLCDFCDCFPLGMKCHYHFTLF